MLHLLFPYLAHSICLWPLEKMNSLMYQFCSNSVGYQEVCSNVEWLLVGVDWSKYLGNPVDWTS